MGRNRGLASLRIPPFVPLVASNSVIKPEATEEVEVSAPHKFLSLFIVYLSRSAWLMQLRMWSFRDGPLQRGQLGRKTN